MRLWLKLGWRNLLRAPRRSAIELASISGAVFLCMWTVNLQSGMYPKMIEEGTRMGSGHVGFYHPDYLELRRSDLTFPADGLLERLAREPGVRTALARVHWAGLARSSRDSRGAAMLGLDFARETGINPLLKEKNLAEGRWPAETRPKEAAMGADLARELGLSLGGKFVWTAQAKDGRMVSRLFRVRGLLSTGIPVLDRSAVIVSRAAAADALGAPGQAHELAVLLDDYRRVEAFLPRARELEAAAPGAAAVPWRTAMPQIADAIRLDRASSFVFLGLIFLIVGIGTANTMLMSVVERVREFGVLRGLGLGGPGIVGMVLAEGIVLGAAGSALGVAAGTALGLYQSRYGMDFSSMMGSKGQEFGGVLIEPVLYSGWDWPRVAAIAAIMCAVAAAASIYPTLRALKIRPADAMRRY